MCVENKNRFIQYVINVIENHVYIRLHRLRISFYQLNLFDTLLRPLNTVKVEVNK